MPMRSRGATATATVVSLASVYLVLAAVIAPSRALAGGTRSVRQTTAKDFEEGEATASTVLPTGDVVAGFKTARVTVDAAFVWSATLSRDGRMAYFGTGDQGRIFAVPTTPPPEPASTSAPAPPSGAPVAGAAPASPSPSPSPTPSSSSPSARKLCDLDAAWITSLVTRPDGSLLAGATPGGTIYAVDPRKGAARPLAKLPTEHVWALVHDGKTGITYAATGGPGKIFAIDGKGGVRPLWDANDKHVVSLTSGAGGALLAGTSDEAIVYRVTLDGRAQALHDFEADEVRAIAHAGKATYFAVNDFEGGDTPPPPPAEPGGPTAAKGTRLTLGGTPVSAGALPRPGQAKARGGVYRLDDDGRLEQVIALADGYFTALLPTAAGDVLAAAGTQGKIYRVASDRTVALVADLFERQALTLLPVSGGFLVGSGDVGGVFHVRPAAAGEAVYLSKVIDAETSARWGRVRFTAAGGVTIETRTGNTAKPDKGWSGWARLGAVAAAGTESEGEVSSPPARYLQYRVTLRDRAAVFREATVFVLPQNQRARVTDLLPAEGGGPPQPAQLADKSAGSGASRVHSPTLKLRWKVENPDNDELVFKVWYRPEDETVWRLLSGPDPLTKAEYDWNTESVPDGRYVLRIWASDEKVTPRERALDFTYESPPVLVDNGKPEVRDLVARPPVVTGRVRDDASVITHIEFAIDGDEWRPASPGDGLLDQRSESFSLRLPPLSPGPHVVIVRGFDGADNVGTARIVVRIAK